MPTNPDSMTDDWLRLVKRFHPYHKRPSVCGEEKTSKGKKSSYSVFTLSTGRILTSSSNGTDCSLKRGAFAAKSKRSNHVEHFLAILTCQIININAETITDIPSTDFPGHWPGESHEWSIEKFQNVRFESATTVVSITDLIRIFKSTFTKTRRTMPLSHLSVSMPPSQTPFAVS